MSRGKIELDMAPRASSSISSSALSVNNSSGSTPTIPLHTNQPSQTPQFITDIHSLHKFEDGLRCSLCKELMRDPVLVKTCLHRFCSNCIHKQASGGLKTCPTCNILLSKKDPFRPDPNFAAIIEKVSDF
uniref:RING-type E3 ubiquitin transferase n=1 Tax=Ditylenchus dipsaci TaxID=166011 RepID=A0A915EDV7_9BILA